ncbi:MAG: glycosyl hydrolase, partial [Clostridiales bacterium]|nr:glycosyl hydrolase [Clostridiales bacterium]
FYWKGNTTPPASYEAWCAMVQALLRHLCDRYGREEVLTWPIEVWNEPNRPGFWFHADMQEYFKLFHKTFDAIKEVDPAFRVGGPAVCGGSDELWIRSFMQYCHDNRIPVDFVTRHHYTTELPEDVGHYGYSELMQAEDGFANLKTTREIIDSFPEYKGLEIHITEFNTSYIPNAPIHDTNQNAAFLAQQLSRLGEGNESYSYWTFGDVFEEQGVPSRPFHGGFGMIANQCIPKPTLWAFHFFCGLTGTCVHRDEHSVILRKADGSYEGVAWNICKDTREDATFTLQLPLQGACVLTTETVDEATCNPLKAWHDMGEPASLTESQLRFLRQAGTPLCETTQVTDGQATLLLRENAVVRFTVKAVKASPDPGYDYCWYAEHR